MGKTIHRRNSDWDDGEDSFQDRKNRKKQKFQDRRAKRKERIQEIALKQGDVERYSLEDDNFA